jgi:hypothetical protein
MRAKTPLDKRQRARLEKMLDELIDLAAQGDAAPGAWQADEVERILGIPSRMLYQYPPLRSEIEPPDPLREAIREELDAHPIPRRPRLQIVGDPS